MSYVANHSKNYEKNKMRIINEQNLFANKFTIVNILRLIRELTKLQINYK